jgi:hypothetical protein
MNWVDLCIEGLLIPGHISHMFLCSLSSLTLTTFDPVTSFISAVNLHLKCPPSLLKGLADSHPNREIWLNSFYEEKREIESLGTFCKIMLGEYWALRKRVLQRPSQLCVSSPLNATKTFFPFAQSLALLFSVTMRTVFGARATGMPLCIGVTPSSFWSLCLCQSVVPFTRVTANTPSARVSYLKMKSLPSGLLPAIPKRNQMSIGFSSSHSTVFPQTSVSLHESCLQP